MAQQANDFVDIARQLTDQGCEITVMGDGMLPALIAAMRDEFIQIDGLWWPSSDTAARPAIMGTLEDCRRYAQLCLKRRMAVQAGGNVGAWPLELADHFHEVITFEPDPMNYECMQKNLSARLAANIVPTITTYKTALGAESGFCEMVTEAGNCGASYTRPGKSVEVQTIDSLELPYCDLLQLDIEGAELPALKGAEQTIRRCSPLIVLELKGHGSRYGYTDPDVHAWLHSLGYRQHGTAHRDVIFKREVEV
jgi:FkbM family methyltransferase